MTRLLALIVPNATSEAAQNGSDSPCWVQRLRRLFRRNPMKWEKEFK